MNSGRAERLQWYLAQTFTNSEKNAYFICFGRESGSKRSFSSRSSMSATFHFKRCSCHVPSPNVKIGIKPTTRIVAFIHGSRRGLYVVDSVFPVCWSLFNELVRSLQRFESLDLNCDLMQGKNIARWDLTESRLRTGLSSHSPTHCRGPCCPIR